LPQDPQSTIDETSAATRCAWLVQQGRHLPWLLRLGHRLLPARCYFCGGAGDLRNLDLCGACCEALPWTRSISHRPRLLEGVCAHAAFDYQAPVAEAVKALKFAGDRRAARVLGAALALQIATHAAASGAALPDVLLPVPLHHARQVERGFNQSLLIARHAGRWLQRPVHRSAVLRLKETRPQTSLPAAQRQANLADAFCVLPQLRRDLRLRKLRRIAVIDDVLTTGATLAAMVGALQAAGLRELQCWSVARAMPANTSQPT